MWKKSGPKGPHIASDWNILYRNQSHHIIQSQGSWLTFLDSSKSFADSVVLSLLKWEFISNFKFCKTAANINTVLSWRQVLYKEQYLRNKWKNSVWNMQHDSFLLTTAQKMFLNCFHCAAVDIWEPRCMFSLWNVLGILTWSYQNQKQQKLNVHIFPSYFSFVQFFLSSYSYLSIYSFM